MRGNLRFLGGQENGLNYCLYIAEEHPVLNNFSFQAGFYLINDNKQIEKNVGTYEGGFACSGGETNPANWQKYVEVDNQITITPYEIENDSELSENSIKRVKSERTKRPLISARSIKSESQLSVPFQKTFFSSLMASGLL